MVFRNGRREYPALAEYLRVASAQQRLQASPLLWVAILGTLMLPFVLDIFGKQEIVSGSYLLLLIAAWVSSLSKKRKPLSPRELMRQEAAKVARQMAICLDKSRLHRDVGDASMEVLESCARSWADMHLSLDGGFWATPDLPPHYANLRKQALEAADLAMDETVLLFRHSLPENPHASDVKGYVGEIIQEAVFGSVKSGGHPPPGFNQARETAEKLAMLAQNVERITRSAEGEVSPRVRLGAGSALDLCIGELKNLQQAEDELRQNLGGT